MALGMMLGAWQQEAFADDSLRVLSADGKAQPIDEKSGREYPLWIGDTQVTSESLSGKSWSYDPTTNTLTLSSYSYTDVGHTLSLVDEDGDVDIIHASVLWNGKEPLVIVLEGENMVTTTTPSDEDEDEDHSYYAIFSAGNLTLEGAGSLVAEVSGARQLGAGIHAAGDMNIECASVKGISHENGIESDEGLISIGKNAGTVVAEALDDDAFAGIYTHGSVRIDGGTVVAKSYHGIYAKGAIVINGGEVTAQSVLAQPYIESILTPSGIYSDDGNVAINGGTVNAKGNHYGIYCGFVYEQDEMDDMQGESEEAGGIAISGGNVVAEASGITTDNEKPFTIVAGICANKGTMTVTGGSVQAIGGGNTACGVDASGSVSIGEGVTSFVAAGTSRSFAEGTSVKNAISGTGWTNEEGTVGKASIAANTDGQDLGGFKRVEFPAAEEHAIRLTGSGHVQTYGDVEAEESDEGIVIGTTGESKRLEQFSVRLPEDTNGGMEYRAHLQGTGWGGWVEGGQPCGTSKEARRIEAVQMRLTGALADTHSVWYRVHSQTWDWLGWARDGQAAGTSGQAKRAEAVEVQVLPQGQAPSDYAEEQASYVGAATADVHLQGSGWTGSSSALEFGTIGQAKRLEALRLETPGLPIAGGVSYEAHVQREGWMPAATDGAPAGTTGEAKRLEAIRIHLTGDAAKDNGYSVWYRVHSQTYGWLGWAHDDEPAGTIGQAKRAEAIDVQVLPQGQLPRDYDASQAACVTI